MSEARGAIGAPCSRVPGELPTPHSSMMVPEVCSAPPMPVVTGGFMYSDPGDPRAFRREMRVGKHRRGRRPSRLSTCMHEAGHAIIQLADHPSPWIDEITIEGLGDDTLGLVKTDALWQPSYMETAHASAEIYDQWRELARRDIIHYLAGPIAELRWRLQTRVGVLVTSVYAVRDCLDDPPPEERSDLGRVRRRLLATMEGDPRKNFDHVWATTEALVADWWYEIRWLGRLLDSKGTIYDEELLAIWREMKAARASSRRRGARPLL